MHPVFSARGGGKPVPIFFVTEATWAGLRKRLDASGLAFADAAGFEPKPGRHVLLPARGGGLSGVLYGLEDADKQTKDLFSPGRLSGLLPSGHYCFANAPHDARLGALAFALNAYRFTRYGKPASPKVTLEVPDRVDGDDVSRIAESVALARDLINTPTNDMGPADLEAAARRLARTFGAKFHSIAGK